MLGQGFREHAARSGYVRLTASMPEAEVVLVEQDPPTGLTPRGLVWLARQGSATRWISHAGLQLERAAVSRMLARSDRTLFHVLYGHAGYAWAARWARRTGHLCVATFHEPPDLAREINVRPKLLNLLDGVILVGSSQRDFFRANLSDPDKLFVVPHGVDIDYFTPIPWRPAETITCLAVGSFLRNFDLLSKIAATLESERNIRFVIVAPRSATGSLVDRRNVEVVHGLSDDALRTTYHDADLFLLAAHDVTANNALLEAMACGLPVIAEEVGSVHDYVGSDNAVVCPPNDVDAMARAIVSLTSRPAARLRMAQASRRRAEQLSWPNVADRTRDVYRTVVERSARTRAGASRTVSLMRRLTHARSSRPTSVQPSSTS